MPLSRLLVLPAALIALAMAAAVAAAQEPEWIGSRDDDGASLLYGGPESGWIVIGFRCEEAGREVTVSFEHEPADAKDGAEFDIVLSAAGLPPGSDVVVRATGERLEMDDLFVLTGITPFSGGLRRIVTEGETLSVKVGDAVQDISLDGAREAAQHLLAVCEAEPG